MKAILLTAGRGDRMRALDDSGPKALLKVRGRSLVVWHILNLVRAGITEIIVSHAAPELLDAVLGDGSRYGAQLSYSLEPAPLGSAGAVAHARPLLGDQPFIVVAADIYCPHFPFAVLTDALEAADLWGNPYPPDQRDVAWIHLVDQAAQRGADFALTSFAVTNQGEPLLSFADIGVYRPEMFDQLAPLEPAELGQLLRTFAECRQVGGDLYRGDWTRVDSLADLALLNAPYSPPAVPTAPPGLHS